MNIGKKLKLAVVLSIIISGGVSGVQSRTTDLIAVSADVVEISGSLNMAKGFSWNQVFDFAERSIEGIFTIGEFERLTGLQTTLALLENEGKVQILSNPKVLAKSGTQAQLTVGGEIPYPSTNSQGVSAEFKQYGIVLNVVPTILPEKGGVIDVQIEVKVSGPDFSQPITIGSTSVPSLTNRSILNRVEMRSGETLVIGGLKSSTRNVNTRRVPVLGRIPLLGTLFRFKEVKEEQRSLFLFITVERVT